MKNIILTGPSSEAGFQSSDCAPPLARRWYWLIGCLTACMLASVAEATLVRKLDLAGLCQRANRIFRGTVMAVENGTVEAGGGKIPTITYRIKVAESLYGPRVGVIDVTMVTDPKDTGAVGGIKRFPLFGDVPLLVKGGDYLLFTTAPSRSGLSTTVGLGQGCFQVRQQNKKEVAVNGANNAGLGLTADGPVAYAELVKRIQTLVKK